MNRKDKESLLIIAFLVSCIAVVALVSLTSRYISPLLLSGFLLVLQVFYLYPQICKYYYRALDAEIGWTRFIPIYNEIAILPSTIATVTIVLWVITGAFGLLSLISVDAYSAVFGQRIAMNMNYYMLRCLIVVYMLTLAVRGFGLCKVTNNVEFMLSDFASAAHRFKISTFLSYVLFFIPVIRIAALAFLYNKLHKLSNLNNYHANSEHDDNLKEVNN